MLSQKVYEELVEFIEQKCPDISNEDLVWIKGQIQKYGIVCNSEGQTSEQKIRKYMSEADYDFHRSGE